MRRVRTFAGVVVMAAGLAWGEGGDAGVTFEVASVRRSVHSGEDLALVGGPGTASPGRITCTNCSLQLLLMNAYGITSNRLERLAGPAWIKTETYDVLAKVPAGATVEQVPIMFENLLKERFGLALHHEAKEADGYSVVLAKNGPAGQLTGQPAGKGAQGNSDGFPKIPAGVYQGYSVKSSRSEARLAARRSTMAQMTAAFSAALGGADVADKTGLTGVYDFTLYFAPGGTIEDPSGNFKATVLRELGLRFEKTKVPMDVIVVDHIGKVPTDN